MAKRAWRAWAVAAAIALALAALGALPGTALASTGRVIRVTTTIQAAVDKARPGDTVVVPPGVYHESVLITTSHLTLRGSQAAVIDATGFDNGIRVGAGEQTTGPDGFPRCPAISVRGVTVDGLTVRGADDNGIFLIGVDGFTVRGGRYLDNHEYGVFPSCSTNGLVEGNFARGANDTGFYVGNDTHVTVTGNRASGNTSAYEVENSSFVVERGNQASGNTAGILVFVLPDLPRTVTSHVLIEGNVLTRNNRPNPVSPTSGEDIGLVPTGTGILDIAGDDVTVRGNRITGNDTVGIAILATPFAGQDPRVEPFPDRAHVVGNVILRNGLNPDLVRSPSGGADILYDGSGTGNCFARNRFGTDLPPGITSLFPCG
jgi:parallel beta-helix repeat protein